jgi:hypothetical protein
VGGRRAGSVASARSGRSRKQVGYPSEFDSSLFTENFHSHTAPCRSPRSIRLHHYPRGELRRD